MKTKRQRYSIRSYQKGNALEYLCLSEDQAVYVACEEDELAEPRIAFKLVDLFYGAGGMTLGFTKAFGHHFKPVWANDFNKYCVETYNTNLGNYCIGGDIVDLLRNRAYRNT